MQVASVDATVVVDPASVARGSSGAVTGLLHLRLGRTTFPEASWNDFPVRVLAAWLRALHGVRSGVATATECLFMDGPFRFRVTCGPSSWRLEALRASATEHVEAVDSERFWRSVVTAARTTLDACTRHDWQDRDMLELRHALLEVDPERAA